MRGYLLLHGNFNYTRILQILLSALFACLLNVCGVHCLFLYAVYVTVVYWGLYLLFMRCLCMCLYVLCVCVCVIQCVCVVWCICYICVIFLCCVFVCVCVVYMNMEKHVLVHIHVNIRTECKVSSSVPFPYCPELGSLTKPGAFG